MKTNTEYKKLCDEVRSKIPLKTYKQLMSQYYCELEYDFLGFLEVYDKVRKLSEAKNKIIIDLGCYMALQAVLFDQEYIGVDCFNDVKRYESDKTTHYYMTIQEFIKTIAQTLDLTQCFAICSYVPDLDATKLAYETFPNIYIYYPKTYDKLKIRKEIKNEKLNKRNDL